MEKNSLLILYFPRWKFYRNAGNVTRIGRRRDGATKSRVKLKRRVENHYTDFSGGASAVGIRTSARERERERKRGGRGE